MPAHCRDCGSLDIALDEPAHEDWYNILATLSDQIPDSQHCFEWLDSKGISDTDAEQTATSMLTRLRYDIKAKAWMYGKTPHYDIWATFRSWCLRDLRQNGHRTGGLQIKSSGGY